MWWQDEPTYAKHHLPDIVSPGEVGKALGQYLRMPQVHPCFGFRTRGTRPAYVLEQPHPPPVALQASPYAGDVAMS